MNNLKIAKQLPFNILLKRILKKVLPAQKTDYTAIEIRRTGSNYTINSLLDAKQLKGICNKDIVDHYLKHEFDLLGSGWVSRNSKKELELSTEHHFFAQNLFKHISDNYNFINWQLDVKSDFIFRNDRQFDNQNINKSKPVEIKNCWEIGRLQHFPQLAIAAIKADNKDEIILEFKNQSLDFISSNPIGMGVQWSCTMDVGIRVSNWLVAFDIFKQIDNKVILNDGFVLIFTDYIHRHAEFIMNHLEHKEGAAGNHYLFNLVGILFATNYLSEKKETLGWREFAEQEIENEFFKQFFADGGNFEGSTTYHCLSSEAMLYATALMLLNNKKLSPEYTERLSKATQFIQHAIKPTGEMPQFGDNDSGRLFVLSSFRLRSTSKKINLLNYSSLLSGFAELFGEENEDSLEASIINQISKNKKLTQVPSSKCKKIQLRNAKHQTLKPTTTVIKFDAAINTSKIKLHTYADFGMYIFKSSGFYLAISAIANKKMHHSWGHVHNDKLSFDLQINGKDIVKDPGTYSYSAYPEKRHEFRSTKAHHGILIKEIEQNKPIGLFYLDREVKCSILKLQDLSITLQANYYGVEHIRKFTIKTNQLIITDYCNKPFKVNINKFDAYSPNYGVIEKINI